MSKKKDNNNNESNAFLTEGCIASAETEVDTETEFDWPCDDEEYSLPSDYELPSEATSASEDAASEFDWPCDDSESVAASEYDSFEDVEQAVEDYRERSNIGFDEDDFREDSETTTFDEDDFREESETTTFDDLFKDSDNIVGGSAFEDLGNPQPDIFGNSWGTLGFQERKYGRSAVIVELAKLGQCCTSEKQIDAVLDLLWMGANGNLD